MSSESSRAASLATKSDLSARGILGRNGRSDPQSTAPVIALLASNKPAGEFLTTVTASAAQWE